MVAGPSSEVASASKTTKASYVSPMIAKLSLLSRCSLGRPWYSSETRTSLPSVASMQRQTDNFILESYLNGSSERAMRRDRSLARRATHPSRDYDAVTPVKASPSTKQVCPCLL